LFAIVVFGLPGTAAALDDADSIRTITVSGQGEAAGSPDRATINAGVQTLASTAIESSRDNQAIIARIMQALGKEDIEDKDIQTADYSVWPEQQRDPRGDGETTITGYRVNNTVRVTVRDIQRLGEILAAVTNAGANSIHGINFSVEDTAALEARSRAIAMEDARTRAESLAELADVKLGKVLTISMASGGGYPMPMVGARMAMDEFNSAPAIAAGQLSVAVQVQVTYAIQ
jgi:uncharacterized protein YggE